MFYNARWYDPAIGRFAQADSIVPPGVQGYDRYAYANNNPLKYTDPSGHFANLIAGAVIGTVAGAFIYTYNCAIHNVEMNGTDLAIAAGVGLAAGTLIGSGVGATAGIGLIASAAGTGMAASAVEYTIAAGSEYSSEEMVTNAAIGAATGIATAGVSALTVGRPLAEVILKGGVSVISGEVQVITSNHINGEPASPFEIFGGGNIGALGTIVSEFSSGIPIFGRAAPLLDDLIRSSVIEYVGNKAQAEEDRVYDTYNLQWR